MKAVLSKAELISLISKIQNIIPSKPAIPILANVLIEAADDQLILSATDLTTSMRCFAPATIIEEGSLVLPAKKFFQLVRELTSPQVKIASLSNDTAEITSGSSIFKVNGLNKNEFPSLPELTGGSHIQLAPDLLKELLSKTAFSVAKEENRYVLTGLLLQIINQKATFIGTDGKRLAKAFTTVDLDPSFQSSYILPIKAVEEMIKILDGSGQKSSLCLMHDKIFLEHENIVLITKLLAGQYPDIEKVIPEYHSTKISLHREELISLLRQISLFTTEITGSVRFLFEKGELKLSAIKSDIGEGHVSMPVNYAGEHLEIAFNPFYFQDILRHSKDETVLLSIQDSYNPGIITDSSSALYVIMPMRLNEKTPSAATHDAQKPVFA